jgi:hypothetical protein
VLAKTGLGPRRENGHPVFLPLTVANDDLSLVEIDILDPQAQALHETKPGTIQQFRHEKRGPLHPAEEPLNLLAR